METIISTVFSEICIDYIVSNTVNSPIIYLPFESGRLLTEGRADTLYVKSTDTSYVKSTDYASANKAGVVKTSNASGTTMLADGRIAIVGATNEQIDEKISYRNPIMPATLDYAVKSGLTTNTEVLTDEEKLSASDWLGFVPRYVGESGFVRTYVWNGAKKIHETMVVSTEGNAGQIPFYSNSVGDAEVKSFLISGIPTRPYHVANKLYVDSKIPNYRLIQDITLEEDIQQIDISTDKDGNPLKLKSVFITFFGTFTGTAGARALKLAYNAGAIYQMYSSVSARIDENQFHFIKSERLNIPDRNIFVSQFPQGLGLVGSGSYNAIQGLSDMNSNLRCDYAEAATIRTINRIQYGQANDTNGLIAAGSRIFIWGIDDDE